MRLRPLRDTSRLTPAAEARRQASVAALAAAIAGAGRGEPVRVLEALAAVVINRMLAARARRAPAAWGVDLAAALRAPGLFPDAPAGEADATLAAASRRIAARAAAGSLPDPTGGALWWHRAGTPPTEAAEGADALRLGGIVFLRPAPRPAEAADGG
ncbi:MAG: cell wall hydrolase [Acetobacteraceae bacterium]|nr:cell wall hydrolase [Acetobacteraceae bacterium]